ncbi:unnamed protein product [Caenorhabditis bovis]|uniref:Uncharacterized protein n=1 Tax=Caenorhabditis bovis TaxID=2654633 RepID=A0A8S1FBH4_9PELO|nr:unnamed protein product [Caenorhabditis bovis]
MYDDFDDAGIGVEFDQCAYEKTFYSQCRNERGDSEDSDRPDSACVLESARDPVPPVKQNFNGCRRKNHLRTFHPIIVKRAHLFRNKMNEIHRRNDGYLLTPQRLAMHLLDFIDISPGVKLQRRVCSDRVEYPLFSVSDSGLEVHSDYFFPLESPYAIIQKSYLRILGEKLARPRRKLTEICNFVERISERSQLITPLPILIIRDWVVEFLNDFGWQIEKIRSKRPLDPLKVLAQTERLCRDIDVVRRLIGDDASKQTWLWEDIEHCWNRIFLLTEMEALQTNNECVRKLQNRWISALLRVMDHIYENGRVPINIGPFVLHK